MMSSALVAVLNVWEDLIECVYKRLSVAPQNSVVLFLY